MIPLGGADTREPRHLARTDPGSHDRQTAEKRGRRAEAIAAWYLRLKGFAILERRYKTPVGEIDLIVRRGRAIVFVEVKARADRGSAAEAVGARTRSRIARAAEWWLSRHPEAADRDFRFDVVTVSPGLGLPHHLQNVFGEGGRI